MDDYIVVSPKFSIIELGNALSTLSNAFKFLNGVSPRVKGISLLEKVNKQILCKY